MAKLMFRRASLVLNALYSLRNKLQTWLREYVNRKKILPLDKRLFGTTCKIKENWRKYRRRAYDKFHDAELSKIRLYDLRHWFATTTYIKTRDIFYVKYALGHRRLENALIYITWRRA